MKEIIVNNNTYQFILVPEDFEIKGWEPSSWEINKKPIVISTTKDITEEQARGIVEKYTDYETERDQLLDGMYIDYLETGNYWVYDSSGIKLWAFKTAKESLQSLIQANGLSLEKIYLILKKI